MSLSLRHLLLDFFRHVNQAKSVEHPINIRHTLRPIYRLKELLELFQISKSSYFYSERAKERDKYSIIRTEIKTIFQENGKCYGYRRIYICLKKKGIVLSEKTFRRIMHQENLVVYTASRKKYSSYKGEISPEVPNLLQRDFHALAPNQKWLTDLTEFALPAGKVYLSPVIDCFDGLVQSWTIGTSPNANLGQHRTIHKRHFSEQQQPRKARITLLIDSREHTASSRQAGPVSQKQIC